MNSVMRLCPKCRKVSYMNALTWDAGCSHCGYNLGKWINRRYVPRHKAEHKIIIKHKKRFWERFICGLTIDLSTFGSRVTYRGNPLKLNEIISLEFRGKNIRGNALVVWSKKIERNTSQAGIMML